MEIAGGEHEEEKIIQNAYFTAEFSYFIHNPNKELIFESPISKAKFCNSEKILFLLWESNTFVRVLNSNYEKVIDYHVLLNGKRSTSNVVDFDFDENSRVV